MIFILFAGLFALTCTTPITLAIPAPISTANVTTLERRDTFPVTAKITFAPCSCPGELKSDQGNTFPMGATLTLLCYVHIPQAKITEINNTYATPPQILNPEKPDDFWFMLDNGFWLPNLGGDMMDLQALPPTCTTDEFTHSLTACTVPAGSSP